MYRFMKLFSAFICMLPHSWQYALGTLLGEIAWLAVPPKRKRLAIGQILFCKITDDPVEAKRIAKASTTRFGRMISMYCDILKSKTVTIKIWSTLRIRMFWMKP